MCIWKIIEMIIKNGHGKNFDLEFAFRFVLSVTPVNIAFGCLTRTWVPHLSSQAPWVELPACIWVGRIKLRVGLAEGGVFALSCERLSTGDLLNQLQGAHP